MLKLSSEMAGQRVVVASGRSVSCRQAFGIVCETMRERIVDSAVSPAVQARHVAAWCRRLAKPARLYDHGNVLSRRRRPGYYVSMATKTRREGISTLPGGEMQLSCEVCGVRMLPSAWLKRPILPNRPGTHGMRRPEKMADAGKILADLIFGRQKSASMMVTRLA